MKAPRAIVIEWCGRDSNPMSVRSNLIYSQAALSRASTPKDKQRRAPTPLLGVGGRWLHPQRCSFALTHAARVLLCCPLLAHHFWRPPLDVAHEGGDS